MKIAHSSVSASFLRSRAVKLLNLLKLPPAAVFAAALFGAGLAGPAFGQQSHGPVIVGAPVTPIKVTVKPAAAAVGSPGVAADGITVPEGEPLPTVAPPPHQPIVDPVFQQPRQKPAIKGGGLFTDSVSAPIVNVPGITSGSNPPDVTGDVGPNHFIQMVNATRYQIFDKAGAPLTGALLFGDLWTPPTGNAGDPIVVYDHLADRWVSTQFFSGGMYFAVSETPDPTAGTWFLYEFNTSTGLPDYPKIGVWPDAFCPPSSRGWGSMPSTGSKCWPAFPQASSRRPFPV